MIDCSSVVQHELIPYLAGRLGDQVSGRLGGDGTVIKVRERPPGRKSPPRTRPRRHRPPQLATEKCPAAAQHLAQGESCM